MILLKERNVNKFGHVFLQKHVVLDCIHHNILWFLSVLGIVLNLAQFYDISEIPFKHLR